MREVSQRNFLICRLCLNKTSEDLMKLDDFVCKTELTSRELIQKFQIVENDRDIPIDTICKVCVLSLESFYNFHVLATAAELKIIEDFKLQELDHKDESISIVFVSETADESEAEMINSELTEEHVFQCDLCNSTYKFKAHLTRHLSSHNKKSKSNVKLQQCELCGEKFRTSNELKMHLQELSCVSSISPACRFCDEKFDDIPCLQVHIKEKHQRSQQHLCPVCFKTFPSVSNRNSHLESHNPENSIHCLICGKGFKSILYLKKHQKAIHVQVENACGICERTFFTQQKFDYHMRSHDIDKRYKCAFCDKSFMQHHHLENHKTTHTGLSKYLCYKCGKEFRQECNLKAHLKTHSIGHERDFVCSRSDCGKTFQTKARLRCHEKKHNQQSTCNECPECGKKYAERASLRAHFQSHFRDSSNKPFKCIQPNCFRSFLQERSLKYHNSAAHGIGDPVSKAAKQPSKYICDYCNQSFPLQSLLRRHVLNHVETEQKTRKHKCQSCEARFKRLEHLRLHMNSVHLKLKPYQCSHPGCEKSFSQSGDRNVHLKTHSECKPHVCVVCQKAFRLAKGLKAHEKIHVNKTLMQAAEIVAKLPPAVVPENVTSIKLQQ